MEEVSPAAYNEYPFKYKGDVIPAWKKQAKNLRSKKSPHRVLAARLPRPLGTGHAEPGAGGQHRVLEGGEDTAAAGLAEPEQRAPRLVGAAVGHCADDIGGGTRIGRIVRVQVDAELPQQPRGRIRRQRAYLLGGGALALSLLYAVVTQYLFSSFSLQLDLVARALVGGTRRLSEERG